MCTGNVCRSPFIERLLQARLDPSSSLTVSSAGTGALVGHPMDERAADQLIQAGGTPDGFVARQLSADLVASAQLVLTATRGHRGEVVTLHPKAVRYTFTFRDFADLASGVEDSGLADAPTGAAWLADVVRRVAARRGVDPPLPVDEADVVDPFRRADGVFRQMSQQVLAALPSVVRVLAS